MPSSYTASARFTLQATGEGQNVWGTILNNGAFALIDFNINGIVTISASGATTLSTANGSTDQARGAMLNYTGATSGTLTIPSVSKSYLIRAATADCIVTNGSTSVTVKAGEITSVMTDGTTIWKLLPNDFGGNRIKSVGAPTANTDAATKLYVDQTAFESVDLPGQSGQAGNYLTTDGTNASWGDLNLEDKEDVAKRATAAQVRSKASDTYLETEATWDAAAQVTLTYASSYTPDLSTFLNAQITLTGNITFNAPTNAKVGQSGVIEIIQDGTGSRTATFDSAYKFANAIKTLSTAAGSKDYLSYHVVASGLIVCSLIKSPS